MKIVKSKKRYSFAILIRVIEKFFFGFYLFNSTRIFSSTFTHLFILKMIPNHKIVDKLK